MKKFLTHIGVGGGLWALPVFALAQSDFTQLTSLGGNIILFINSTLVPLVFAIAFLVFIWGAARYFIFSGGSEEGKEAGKELMLWGLIGFFVMVAVWGIVNLLVGASGFGNQPLQNIPTAPSIR